MITASLVSSSADVAVIELHMTLKRLISQRNRIVSGCLLSTPRPDLFNYLSISPSWPCFPFLGWLLGCIFLEVDLNSFYTQSLLNLSQSLPTSAEQFTVLRFFFTGVRRSDDIIEKSTTDPESSSPSVQSKDYWVTRHHFHCTDITEFPSLQLVVPETLLFPRHLARHCVCTSQPLSLSLCIFTF